MELKQKEEKANNKKISVGTKQIVPGYMEINPWGSAINIHSLPLTQYVPRLNSVVTTVIYRDLSTMTIAVLWLTYTKQLLKWITKCVSEIFGRK